MELKIKTDSEQIGFECMIKVVSSEAVECQNKDNSVVIPVAADHFLN